LGLNMDVERTSIEGMGCLTGFRLLNLARQVSLSDPKARILVVAADLRSALGNSMPSKPTREDIVSVSLFRDAASAAVVGGQSHNYSRSSERPCYEIVTGLSRIVEGTDHLVDYHETNEGAIRLFLHRDLPENIGKSEPGFVSTLLEKGRKVMLNKSDDAHVPTMNELRGVDILCHTGGPKVLREVAKCLGLTSKNLYSSWEVMKNNGNLSGASNLSVLNHHNEMAMEKTRNVKFNTGISKSKWAICLSMGPGVCLEGILIRDARKCFPELPMYKSVNDRRKVVHIVGGGIAGLTLAAKLDPSQYIVRVFEASTEIREKGYGLAIWPSTMRILRDQLGITGLDFRTSTSMVINRPNFATKLEIKPKKSSSDKGFMKRSALLKCILERVLKKHPGCIYTGHRCIRIKFGSSAVAADFECNGSIVSHSCDLLVGADGVNSIVRKYVSCNIDSKSYGHMTAYRFMIPSPSPELLKQTEQTWNMSISSSIHSPAYHVSSENSGLNVVVLEYDGGAPSQPRSANIDELEDVAKRSKLDFIINMLKTEKIEDLMCYSTYHVDAEPWHQPLAVIIGDAAHAYGPLTAKMANLAVNDAYTLGEILNHRSKTEIKSQDELLHEWEAVQRPKFEVTKLRTLRHLQLYSPTWRGFSIFLWRVFPGIMSNYFGSIFAYDYSIYSKNELRNPTEKPIVLSCHGIVGMTDADPLTAFLRQWVLLTIIFVSSIMFPIICLMMIF